MTILALHKKRVYILVIGICYSIIVAMGDRGETFQNFIEYIHTFLLFPDVMRQIEENGLDEQ